MGAPGLFDRVTCFVLFAGYDDPNAPLRPLRVGSLQDPERYLLDDRSKKQRDKDEKEAREREKKAEAQRKKDEKKRL